MGNFDKETFEAVNFRTGTIPHVSMRGYVLKIDQVVVQGEAVKLVGGKLEKLADVGDTIFAITAEACDSTGDDKDIVCDFKGSYFESAITFGTGTVADFKAQLDTAGKYLLEKGE